MPALASLLTAVDTNTRSPHTIGLETDTPGTGVFHKTFSPVAASHFTGVGDPSATPDAAGPRNIGQFWAESVADAMRQRANVKRVIFFYLALGPHPQRGRSLTPHRGFAGARRGVAAGAFLNGAGAPPPARAFADASRRTARHSRRRLPLLGLGTRFFEQLNHVVQLASGRRCQRVGQRVG